MKKLLPAIYIPNAPIAKDVLINYLDELRKKYPASSMINFIYLKLIFENNSPTFQKLNSSCFSTIINKRLFFEYEIERGEENGEDTNDVIEELITKFSDNPPKIGHNPAVSVSDDDFGKASLKEDAELISETLANIYAEQGYLRKAEKMFQKLASIYPEKNVYFAAQIKKLKNIENNQ